MKNKFCSIVTLHFLLRIELFLKHKELKANGTSFAQYCKRQTVAQGQWIAE